MDEPTYPCLTMEFYNTMLESSLNPDYIISEVKGKPLNMAHELITDFIGLPNSGIIIKEEMKDEKPYSKYN